MPQFAPSVVKIALAPITIAPAGLSCESEVFIGSVETTKLATSGRIPFASTGSQQPVNHQLTIPASPGTYHVYIDVYVAGQLFLKYIATEDVIIGLSLADKLRSMVKAHPGVFTSLSYAVPDLWNLFWSTMRALEPVAGPGLVVPAPPPELLKYFPGYLYWGLSFLGMDYDAVMGWFIPRMTAAQMTSALGYMVAALLASGYTPEQLIEWTT